MFYVCIFIFLGKAPLYQIEWKYTAPPQGHGKKLRLYLWRGLYIRAQPDLSPDPIDQYNGASILQSLGPQLGFKI